MTHAQLEQLIKHLYSMQRKDDSDIHQMILMHPQMADDISSLLYLGKLVSFTAFAYSPNNTARYLGPFRVITDKTLNRYEILFVTHHQTFIINPSTNGNHTHKSD